MSKKYLFYISQNYSFAMLRPIQKLLWERGDNVRWFFEGTGVNPGYLQKSETQLSSMDSLMDFQPDVVIATANSIPGFLPGLKTCVFHGFDAGKLDSRGRNDHFKIRGCFDLYCTQGPSTTREFKRLQQELGYFNVIETGWPALDPLFQPVESRPSKQPTVLFCSTFSKRLSAAPHLLSEIDSISRQGSWHWLVQFHPKMDPEITNAYKNIEHERLRFVETDNLIPLLQAADVMLCDTSSVISMFLVQQKPVVTFRNIRPGPHLIDIHDEKALESALGEALSRPRQLMEAISQHTQELHPYRDGRSSQRVIEAIDQVLDGVYPLRKKRPENLLRNLKFRKRLNYWRP